MIRYNPYEYLNIQKQNITQAILQTEEIVHKPKDIPISKIQTDMIRQNPYEIQKLIDKKAEEDEEIKIPSTMIRAPGPEDRRKVLVESDDENNENEAEQSPKMKKQNKPKKSKSKKK